MAETLIMCDYAFTQNFMILHIISTTSKNIVIDLNKGENLNDDNYEIQSMKVQYMLKEQKALETLNIALNEPKVGNTTQQKRDLETYNV